MGGLREPAWLMGLAALLLPVALHLWSRGARRTVRLGSARWLLATGALRPRRLRPWRMGLLAVRCLLLGAAVLALADPWLSLAPARPRAESAAWVLVDPALLAGPVPEDADPRAAAAVAEARAGAAHGRLLAPGLPRLPTAGEAGSAAPAHDPWSLLREADALAPPGRGFRVVAVDRQANLRGPRPGLAREVEWIAVPAAGSNRWIERGSRPAAGRLDLRVGVSDRHGTVFQHLRLAADPEVNPGDSAVLLTRRREGLAVRLRDGGTVPGDDAVTLEPRPVVVTAVVRHTADRATDADSLVVALEAAAEVAGVRLEVDRGGLQAGIGPAAPLAFWLGAEAVPPEVADGLPPGGALLTDAGGRWEACDAAIRLPWAEPAPPPRLRRCAEGRAAAGEVVVLWRDDRGAAVLTARRVGAGRWLRLATRIHPDWSDLPFHPALPHWLLRLLEESMPPGAVASAARSNSDRRAAGAAEATPSRRDASPSTSSPRGQARPLWAAAFLLFALERLMARRGGSG